MFSTMSNSARGIGKRPFQLRRPTTPFRVSPRAVVVAVGRRVLEPIRAVRSVGNRRIGLRRTDDPCAMGPEHATSRLLRAERKNGHYLDKSAFQVF